MEKPVNFHLVHLSDSHIIGILKTYEIWALK